MVAISPDGRLGLCGGGGPARLWDLTTGILLRELGVDGAGDAGLWTDGRHVVASPPHRAAPASARPYLRRNRRSVSVPASWAT